MSSIDLKVGKKEIHNIFFEMNRWTWHFKITVDGNPINGGWQFVIGSKEIKFNVGVEEKHKICINWRNYPNNFYCYICSDV
jgi:hypothetical protein